MQPNGKDPLSYFRLQPLKAAKVSEISETTASSTTPPEERVNFHIGNPVQDGRLASAYLRIVLGIDIRKQSLDDEHLDELLAEAEWKPEERPKLEFLRTLIRRSSPYMPRGGYARSNPNNLVKAFHGWLIGQQEPLSYDLGQTSGRREVILASGGINESLRIFFHALSTHMVMHPVRILRLDAPLPAHLATFPGLEFSSLSGDETKLEDELMEIFRSDPAMPTFLVLGKILGEESRRFLRNFCLHRPTLLVEINNAPNHLSLVREAKLMDRVIRFLTPAVFSPLLADLATVFIAGNSEFLAAIETVHFQLKGSPSASEVELLTFLLEQKLLPEPASGGTAIEVDPPFEGVTFGTDGRHLVASYARSVERTLAGIIDRERDASGSHIARLSGRVESIVNGIIAHPSLPSLDRFGPIPTIDLLNEFLKNISSRDWLHDLEQSFLSVFVRHHPEYRRQSCVMVSGSSRTALGLLGYHCGIREVVTPDLGWTYEHCFPRVEAVPLTPRFGLDAGAVIKTVERKLADDPLWHTRGAVVINNPHNATGQLFEESEVRTLIRWVLEHKVPVIDDLSYQNVAPTNAPVEIATVRQMADEMVRNGWLGEDRASLVITIHSMSKTDCLAGARLAVAEIREPELFERFRKLNGEIRPNIGGIFLTYLFYRNDVETARAYARLRNRIFLERSEALLEAVRQLPRERNPFDIEIIPPRGSMYPLMVIRKLPPGLSLDWVAAGLARQGIGIIPIGTFARTEEGFETGRKTFRLTLGGSDGAEVLFKKTRRVLIDLNRLIAEEGGNYSRKQFAVRPTHPLPALADTRRRESWESVETMILRECDRLLSHPPPWLQREFRDGMGKFRTEFLPERLGVFRQRFADRAALAHELTSRALLDHGKQLEEILAGEFSKDTLERRREAFSNRLFDRTVHPTQMYSIRSEMPIDKIIARLLRGRTPGPDLMATASQELLREFLALNVAISSSDESDELILDLDTQIAAENYSFLCSDTPLRTFVSFWGDWDGSNRPSGQGHRLVASVLIENVRRLSRLIGLLASRNKASGISPAILSEIERIPSTTRNFAQLLHRITVLTHQLESRYRGILPFHEKPGRMRQVGMALGLARDPVTLLWRHNDRLERRMMDLRQRRKEAIEYYFSLNKRLRKQLHSAIPEILKNLKDPAVLLEACLYRDLLQRFTISPRITQSMITAQDQFAIDTTVHNVHEINEVAGKYGNPGMVVTVQMSMSTRPEALIALDRKMLARREEALRANGDLDIPTIWLVPLFEDVEAVRNIPRYLNKIWEYAHQSRRIDQETRGRFSEIIAEVFIAGSDLSQAVGQAAGGAEFRASKHEIVRWLAERGLVREVRIKLGSGEPMQRQGGYYAEVSGEPAFIRGADSAGRFTAHLHAATRRSADYATTPLMGVFAGGDLRTFQSTISEKMRFLPVSTLSQLQYHVAVSQRNHRKDLVRASEELVETRFHVKKHGELELQRLTVGITENLYQEFLSIYTENFRQILYGREEDVVGIHLISYFIARTIPPLRDRPTVRPRPGPNGEMGQRILERIAETIPFSRYGSLLRAIAHNQAQTAVLGINQLTTGLFRALDHFAQKEFAEGETETLIAERILTRLPIYEILQSLRLYHDVELRHMNLLARAFPAGNSAFLALREDIDAMDKYIGLFQQELLRRHGLDVSDFFEGAKFIPDLLPTLRPDLAVLLQPDLFNTDVARLQSSISGSLSPAWLASVHRLLSIPDEIKAWRTHAWGLIEQPVYQRVESFSELALSLNSLSVKSHPREPQAALKGLRLSPDLSNFFRTAKAEDEMRQFLAATLEYLAVAAEGMVEVPVTIVRAMREVEQIAKIEEQALSRKQQDLLRFYLLQIARLAGENG